MIAIETYGALSRSEPGAGIPTGATAVSAGDPQGHWTVSGGRLYPSAAGVANKLDAGPYLLSLDNGEWFSINIEPDTWDVTDKSEWDFVATQSTATLAGKTIALRNAAAIDLGITGGFGRPLRLANFSNGGTPLTVKGRLGAVGDWENYCTFVGTIALNGTQGVTFKHLKSEATATKKFHVKGHSSSDAQNIVIEDCWLRGVTGDPNDASYATSTNYPNYGVDLITTEGTGGQVGNLTIRDCLLEWGQGLVNVTVYKPGHGLVIENCEGRYFYADAFSYSMGNTTVGRPLTFRGNFIHSGLSLPTDSALPHSDALQIAGKNSATADWTGLLIENNIVLPGNSRGKFQCFFIDDMNGSGFYFSVTFTNNLVVAGITSHGLTIGQPKNCNVQNNTVVSFDEANTATVRISLFPDLDGGGNTVSNNIADDFNISGNVTASGNYTAGRNGSILDYATLFDGPTWAPVTPQEARNNFRPKVSAGALAN